MTQNLFYVQANNLESFFEKVINSADKPVMMSIPILITVFTVLISLLIGVFRGWIGALSSFLFNLAAILIGVFTGKMIIISFIQKKFSANSFVHLHQDVFAKILLPIVVLVFILIFAIVNEIFCLVIRKIMLKKIRNNKAVGKSNAGIRLAGASISLVSVLPVAIFANNLVSTIAYNNPVSKINDIAIDYTTLYRGTGIASEMPFIKSAMSLYLEKAPDGTPGIGIKNFSTLIEYIVGFDTSEIEHDLKSWAPDKKEKYVKFLKDIINSKSGEMFMNNYFNKFKEGNTAIQDSAEKFTKIKDSDIDIVIAAINGPIEGINENGKRLYKNSILNFYKNSIAGFEEALEAKIDSIISKLFK